MCGHAVPPMRSNEMLRCALGLVFLAIPFIGCDHSAPKPTAAAGANHPQRHAVGFEPPARLDYSCRFSIQDRMTGESLRVSAQEPGIKIEDLSRVGRNSRAMVARSANYGVFIERIDGGSNVSLQLHDFASGAALADVRASFRSAHILASRNTPAGYLWAECDQPEFFPIQSAQSVSGASFACLIFMRNAEGIWTKLADRQIAIGSGRGEIVPFAEFGGLRLRLAPANSSTMQLYLYDGRRVIALGEASRSSSFVELVAGAVRAGCHAL